MDERRQDVRDKVIFGGVAAVPEGSTTDCVVRNLSEHGARIEFKSGLRTPKGKMALTIMRKGCSFNARIIWKRDNVVGVAFTEAAKQDTSSTSDLEERLRKSEAKKRQLQRQIKHLLGEG